LCDTYARLSENHGAVFISTILRHVEDDDRKAAHARRIRIRRLNSLAADLSREFGAFVIDLDRVLADIGAGRLGTDYRLKGDAAIDLAGKAMATEIVANGLDALAEVDVQDAAIAYLARYQINDALLQEIKPLEIRPHNVMALGRGRRKQFVETVIDNDQNGHVGWLVQQALKGKISPAAAFDKLNQAVRRRGTGESIAMLARALVRIGRRA
jgi:hypothetical protein